MFKIKITSYSMAIALGLVSLSGSSMESHLSAKKPIMDNQYQQQAQAMLQKMSLSEKLDLLSGPGMDREAYVGIKGINLAPGRDVEGVAGYINGVKNEQLDIPAIKLADGPAGLRIQPTRKGTQQTFYATSWPIASLLASSWDPELVRKVGQSEGDEVKRYGADFLLAPSMNIQRNPLIGRNFEYYSEDPIVAGEMAASMVEGIQSNGVGATVKHFVANNAETNRFFSDSIIEPRVLREIYLRGFRIAVTEAHPWAVMTSYNLLNGTYTAQRHDLLTDVLRDEWGFKGLVMSDWFSSNVFGLATDFTHNATEPDHSSAAKQIKAGNDLIQPGGVKADLEAALKQGSLTEQDVDRSALAILTQIQKTPSFQHFDYQNDPDLDAHAALTRDAAAQGMVLLKNEQAALPLSQGAKVAAFGTVQINTLKGGTGSGDVNSDHIINIADGLADVFNLDKAVYDYYKNYWDNHQTLKQGLLSKYPFAEEPPVSDNDSLQTLIEQAAKTDSAAIVTIGRQAGEGEDRTFSRGDYLLSNHELALIDTLSTQFHKQQKPVIVLLNVNGIVDTHEWQDKVDGIVLTYMGGQQMGYAVADILSGKVNPSGKLAQTIPLSYEDVPSAKTFPGAKASDGLHTDVRYDEGLYVGYRYYTTFNKPVAYPFGFGLSYTQFNIDKPLLSANTLAENGQLQVTATVHNKGSVAGKEVAQLYVSAPAGKLKKPAIELKAFAKTESLAAGATQTVTMNVDAQRLASFDPARDVWVLEPGEYSVYVAASSDVKESKPVSFKLEHEVIVAHATKNALAMTR